MVKIQLRDMATFKREGMTLRLNVNSVRQTTNAGLKESKSYWVSTRPLKNAKVLTLVPKTAGRYMLKYRVDTGGFMAFCYRGLLDMLEVTTIPTKIYYKEAKHG